MKRREMTAIVLCCYASLSSVVPSAAQTSVQEAIDRGAVLYRQGHFEEAAVAFARAAELDPGSLSVWESLGWAHRKAGALDDAREVWSRILKVDPSRASLWNQLAAIDIEQENWGAAAESLEKSLRLEPSESHVRSRLAMALESAGRIDEAAETYEELVRRDSGNLTAIKRLASFYERVGRNARALQVLEEASSRLPHFAHIFRIHIARLEARQADRAFAEGDFSGAIAGYRDAVESNPRNTRYLENLGWAHRKKGDLTEAVDVWRMARKRNPSDATLVRHLADAVRESGDHDEARRLYHEAWEMEPGSDAVVPFRLAEDALAGGRVEEAVGWVTKLFRLPQADEIWSERIAALFARFEFPEAGIAVFRARAQHSAAPHKTAAAESRLHARLGMRQRQSAEIDTAIASYQEALRLDPANRVALRDLGWAYWVLSDWEACAETWERLSALDPNGVDALNLLTHLHLYRRDYDEAIRTASASLELDPNQPVQSLKLARALHWSGRYAEGKALAEGLARDYPEDLDIQRFWAELLMQYHEFELGLSTWQRVLALGGGDTRAEFFYVKSLYETGQYDAALAEGRKFALSSEAHEGLLRLLADDAFLRDDLQQARGWLKQLTEQVPDKVEIWRELAELESELGSPKTAMATIERALERHPESVELETTRGNLLRRQGRAEEAFHLYEELARAHPENREVFSGFFQTASETGRVSLALGILASNRATFLKPYEVELERARLLYAVGDGKAARELLEESIHRDRAKLVVPVLLYHGLGDHPRTPAMPADRFDSQMKALQAKGYQPLTVPELDRIMRGELPAPERPILITFDDARIDSFELADPILARYGMKATMFVPTGLTLDEHPFFADWDLLVRFAGTGRWDLQAHGHHAHDLVEIASDGTEGSFLVNRMWLPDEGRLETEDEYLERIEEDYRRVKQEIESRIPGTSVVGYAFPFSEAGQETAGNYPLASQVNEDYLGRHFRFGFLQDANGYNEIGSSGSLFLKRYSVPRDFDGEDLLRRLARERPRTRALQELAKIQMWTGLYGEARRSWASLVDSSPILADEAAFYLASIDFRQGNLRSARSHLEAAKRAGRTVRIDEMANLERRISWEESIRIAPQFTMFEDSADRLNRAQALGFTVGSLAPLEIRASFGTMTFEETSFEPVEAVQGEVGLRLHASSHLYVDARVRQRDARRTGPDSTNYWGTLGVQGDRVELVVRGGREDVDTLRARLDGIELESYQLQHLLRLSPRFWVHLDARYGEYSDGNERQDLVGRISFRPWSAPGWRIGVAGGWTDSRIQSAAYYTPEELRFGRGLLSYSRSFSSGWNVDTSIELGWARDTLRGDRFTAHARGHAIQAWSSRFRSSFGWSFSSSPGYQSWSLTLGLHYGFTAPVELGQSSLTAQ